MKQLGSNIKYMMNIIMNSILYTIINGLQMHNKLKFKRIKYLKY